MDSIAPSWLYRGRVARSECLVCRFSVGGDASGRRKNRISFPGSFFLKNRTSHSGKSVRIVPSIKCAKSYEDGHIDPLSVERPPYDCYMDSTSGQLEPASGARASIPGKDYWPEGTSGRVRAARAPEPVGKSETESSYGKNPGSRRRNFKGHAGSSSESFETSMGNNEQSMLKAKDEVSEDVIDPSHEYVVYQTQPKKEILSEYEEEKRLGHPHPFIDPALKKPIENPRTSDELWWNWRNPEKEQWSRWQRRRPDVDTVFAKAMAETGQIKLYGDHPTLAESALAKARKEVFKEERLEAERRRLEEIGPIAYYSEWVEAWTQDTSREAVQRHYEETGEDENFQLITMFQHQTAEEYRIMMGTDIRIKRDPLAMKLREDQIKEIWGGDPVYPTVNYIQDPNEVTDFRGADFHEPTPNMLSFLLEHGHMISRNDLDKLLDNEKHEELEVTDTDEAMASAVDIGESDDEDEGELDVEDGVKKAEEKITRNWSVLKSTPQLNKKTKDKSNKDGKMSIDDAIDDSENLTDFLLDFDEEE
ncbi:Plastid transcriptionally active 12 [Zostera marina]|uniref:Plastid transcriptionally active 12 n=1 Tax=Zostera marina TaxID=29655 RepID=A0A0K9P438_ZOSMR|nr:Plastid transcriptionally active 12 [Zostera marina]